MSSVDCFPQALQPYVPRYVWNDPTYSGPPTVVYGPYGRRQLLIDLGPEEEEVIEEGGEEDYPIPEDVQDPGTNKPGEPCILCGPPDVPTTGMKVPEPGMCCLLIVAAILVHAVATYVGNKKKV